MALAISSHRAYFTCWSEYSMLDMRRKKPAQRIPSMFSARMARYAPGDIECKRNQEHRANERNE